MISTLQLRAETAKAKIAWMRGALRSHPCGLSGADQILPYEDMGKSCWDTHPRGWLFSEYGNDAGACE